MVISELIEVLKEAKKQEGDITISVSSEKGIKIDFEIMSGVYIRAKNKDGKWDSINTLCLAPLRSLEAE